MISYGGTEFYIGADTRSAPQITSTAGRMQVIDFHLSNYVPSAKQIMEWHRNTLAANPKITPYFRPNINQVIDDTGVSGNYLLQDMSANGNDAVLNNYTANQATFNNKEYQVIPVHSTRDNEIHENFIGDTVSPMSEQINLHDDITAPTDTYIFEGNLPIGLSLSASGALSGTATETGTFDLLIRLVDGRRKL